MKKIKVFIAGAKELKQERDCLKVLASNLNNKYSNKDIQVLIHSYEDFNDKQDEYNSFIEREADIAIFILDGRIGSKTEEEFLKATDALSRENRPEVILFLHEHKELTPEIARIEGLIKGRLGDKYCVDYSDNTELQFKAKERIIRYIEKQKEENPVLSPIYSNAVHDHTDKEHLKQPAKGGTNSDNRTLRALLYSIIGLLVILTVFLFWRLSTTSVRLIFAGGGSVKNFLEVEKNLDVVAYPHSIYVNMASGNAWSLLAEEANREQEYGENLRKSFSTICLSADNIDSSSFFNEKTKLLFKYYKIFKYYLGEDPLVVYVSRNFIGERWTTDNTTICVDSLRSLVKEALTKTESVRLFTTSKSSGTLRLYQSCFSPKDTINLEQLLDKGSTFMFYQKSSENFFKTLSDAENIGSFIVLGSKYYYPQELEGEDMLRLCVRRGNNTISKPMNLYFIGRKNENDTYCTIKKSIIRFLQDIHAEENINSDTWNNLKSGKIKFTPGEITELNELK